ncbi:MAG: hypothetical protein ACI9G1_001496 [Pirellulaceae bacterium]
MTNREQVIVKSPTEGRTIGIVGDIYRFLATGKETDGKYARLKQPFFLVAGRRLISIVAKMKRSMFSRARLFFKLVTSDMLPRREPLSTCPSDKSTRSKTNRTRRQK